MRKINYKLEQSPLFRLSNKSKLADLLKINKKTLLKLSKNPPYNSFYKDRNINEPKKNLKKVQSRLKDILARIETPHWLFSGKKGVSYIDNASYHKDSPYVVTCDIASFYPNCKKEKVFQIFKYHFKMADDVAWVLTDLLCFKGSLPIGSPSSQIVAFWAYRPTFERVYQKISSFGGKISLYVDDISISSEKPIPKNIVQEIDFELRKVGHKIKPSKTKRYGKCDFKLITGSAISPNGVLKIPNKRRKKLINSFQDNEISKQSIVGQIRAGQMIEKNYCKETLRKLTK